MGPTKDPHYVVGTQANVLQNRAATALWADRIKTSYCVNSPTFTLRVPRGFSSDIPLLRLLLLGSSILHSQRIEGIDGLRLWSSIGNSSL